MPSATGCCGTSPRCCERELRNGDTLARVGGEEFAVVLFGVDLDDAVAFSERIGRELQARGSGDTPPLSTSAGVAALSEADPARRR